MDLSTFFKQPKPIIGMLHLLPLPGSPRFEGDIKVIYQRAEWEASILADAGLDGIIVENFGDEPYLIGKPTSAQLALMAAITRQVSRSVSIPVGVNVQFNAWQAELAIAYACGATFIRVEVFVDTAISAQGLIQPCSAQITRYRKALDAESVALWADVQTKYTTNFLSQSLMQSALDAEAAGADALIVTGAATGQATPLEAIAEAKQAVSIPVIAGSGTTIENVADVLTVADGAIVGSALKEGGHASNRVSPDAAKAFMRAARA
jgi:membrane complex biogenesis BtpA family protein